MTFDVLPTRAGNAAENMAVDFLLLQRYPTTAAVRFRHYGWHRPAFTYGYSQKVQFVRDQLPPAEVFDLCRRPTGGGVVDHREDWTYSLVIPRGHPLEEVRATQSYRAIHEALAAALERQDVAVELKVSEGEASSGSVIPGVCFQRAEVFDVVEPRTGKKIAGAAQKRNKHGLLFQGSIWRPSVAAAGNVNAFDWDRFHDDFTAELSRVLGLAASPTPWPDFNEDEVSGLTEQYSSPEWLEHR